MLSIVHPASRFQIYDFYRAFGSLTQYGGIIVANNEIVSCSLAMGIPPQVVMKATGHKGYKTKQPYIDTATETQTLEMERWNKNQYRSEIITRLDKMTENELSLVSQLLQDKDKLLTAIQEILELPPQKGIVAL